MFALAIFIGIYSYLILSLGFIRLLYGPILLIVTLLWLFGVWKWYRKDIQNIFSYIKSVAAFSRLSLFFVFLLILQMFVNIIGVLGPELSFDALWYHLTLPKIYLQNHQIFHIPGGLFYYSDMPKLAEMLYIVPLSIGNEIGGKFIHFLFGVLTLLALYQFARKFLPRTLSLLVLIIFYSSLVVGWESITAYTDLVRTFFEIMALWGFVNWTETKEKKWLIESGVMLGLAISTKVLALGSLAIFSLLIVYVSKYKNFKQIVTSILAYWYVSILVVLPWFVFALINTGNPVYPFFTKTYPVTTSLILLNPLFFLKEFFTLFIFASDPINPIYLIILPLIIVSFRSFKLPQKIIILYSLLSIFIWYITPRTGGGRFILPYLPAFSLLAIFALVSVKERRIRNFLLVIILMLSFVSIGYRFIANKKFIPVFIGKESRQEFLASHLNFSFGDFYDVDGYFSKTIKKTDKVLIYGGHNLYYANFPFIHESYIKKGDQFNYILTQNQDLPKRFAFWNLVYINEKTGVKLYSLGGKIWIY